MAIRIMGIHGLGDHRDRTWIAEWGRCIAERAGFSADGFQFVGFSYDDIFESIHISMQESLRAMAKLLGSAAQSWWEELFRRRSFGGGPGARGPLQTARDKVRWTAGYVVAWCEDRGFREQVRRRLLRALADEQPDVVLAHSLGSLISFDAMAHSDAGRAARDSMGRMTYVTFGSQLGSPFVRNRLEGRLRMLPVRRWFHLFNSEDNIFTAPVSPHVRHEGFRELTTYFNCRGWADHAATGYLGHRVAQAILWPEVRSEPVRVRMVTGTQADAADSAISVLDAPGLSERAKIAEARGGRKRPSRRAARCRALLVGINNYPNPDDRLEGCVNDVYLMSSVLQETRFFRPDDIRIVLNERATAVGILERLHWLFDDPRPGDVLLFYYSGHGAQIPAYGKEDEIDDYDETLVPYDFNWRLETSITDDTIYDLYIELPPEVGAYLIFDCCHSGSMHRSGMPRVRGLTPPEDIRHRALRWADGRWQRRPVVDARERFAADPDSQRKYVGEDGDLFRIGRALSFRPTDAREYNRLKRSSRRATPRAKPAFVGADAPTSRDGRRSEVYLPTILEACREAEFAYEYRDGAASYGAFTFFAARALRRNPRITPEQLRETVEDALINDLNFEQHPELLAPPVRRTAPLAPAKPARRRR